MAEEQVVANRRMKIFIGWTAVAALMVIAQKIFGFDVELTKMFLSDSGTAALVLIGGLSATDAVQALANRGVKK